MQRRYCRCGRPVLVDYKPMRGSWRAVFWSARAFFRSRLFRCPACGEALSIDSLG